MKIFIFISLFSLLMLGCKPEPKLENLQNNKIDLVSKEAPDMQLKEHIAEVRLTVPDSTWSIKILNVTQTKGQIAVICKLNQVNGMGLMVISEAVDAVKFMAKDLPIKYYIQGKTWNWENAESYTLINDESEINIRDGEPLIFEQIKPERPGGPKKHSIGTPL